MLLGNLNKGTGTAVGWAAVGLGTLRQRRGFMPKPEHGAARGAGPGARQGRRTEGRDERFLRGGEELPPNRSGHGGEGRVVGNGNIPFQRKGQEIHFSCRIS